MTQHSHSVPPRRRGPGPDAARPSAPRAALPGAGRFSWLAPMVLWPVARRQLPRAAVRPQGGGSQRADDEAMFAAILYVLVSGVPWRALPGTFTVSWQNAHRRFTQWSEAGLWDRVLEAAGAQRVPGGQSGQLRQWAETVGALADERLNRSTALPADRGDQPPAQRRTGGLRPVLRVHEPDDFTVRLFGPDRGKKR
ncbi:transposase [Streptomyces sp. NPDC046887]|uniref:transposase n=1 Tax=Streptomyces sp. NPDC046887 TaxID=3155472 RepID=UPI00340C0074